MVMKIIQVFFFFFLHLGSLSSANTFAIASKGRTHMQTSKSYSKIRNYKITDRTRYHQQESTYTTSQRDVITPITTTTPAYNPLATPTNPTLTITPPTDLNPNPYPATGSSGQSWCVASQSALETALQVGLDYACGDGDADCSEIQQGGSCFNPDTVRDHASYAFSSYYQKNPSQTSCDFGGTAIITNTDPSSSTCQYPSLSTSSSTLNTTNPIGGGSTVFGSSPPYTDTNSIPTSTSSSFTLIFFLISLIYLKVYK